MTRSTNMEHVEVLRHMKETIKAIMPSEVAALDAAIASLSAPQPPAEAQAQGGGAITCPECHGTGGHYWHEADGSERGERCATCYGFGYYTAPPSAPEMELPINDAVPPPTQTQPGNLFLWNWRAMQEYGRACVAHALAQQPAAVDEASVVVPRWFMEKLAKDARDIGMPEMSAAIRRVALTAKPGGSDNDR